MYTQRVYTNLSIMSFLYGFLECSSRIVMLLPRSGYSVVEGGRRGCSYVLVSFGEGRRLHSAVVNDIRTCSAWWWSRRGLDVASRLPA
jgi:hypothetical protein